MNRTTNTYERCDFTGHRVQGHARRGWARAFLALLACLFIESAPAQNLREWTPALSGEFLKSGPAVLRAFKAVAEATRASVVVIAQDGWRAALGTIVDTNGFLITKASELKTNQLACTLVTGQEVAAVIVATDDANDVALLKINAKGLKPMAWTTNETSIGQWVMTPGVGIVPEAVGIISVPTRKILPKRALIGVTLSNTNGPATIESVTPGFGAAKAGLKPGDVILSVNGKPVGKREELTGTLREIREGRTVKLRVKREEEEFDADVEMTGQLKVIAAELAGQAGGRGFGRGPGRGFGFGFDREDRMNRMGSGVSTRAEDFESAIQHDTVLEPWQCGGPLVNLDGKAIGINIARAGRVASYALPASLVTRIVANLKAQAATSMGTK